MPNEPPVTSVATTGIAQTPAMIAHTILSSPSRTP